MSDACPAKRTSGWTNCEESVRKKVLSAVKSLFFHGRLQDCFLQQKCDRSVMMISAELRMSTEQPTPTPHCACGVPVYASIQMPWATNIFLVNKSRLGGPKSTKNMARFPHLMKKMRCLDTWVQMAQTVWEFVRDREFWSCSQNREVVLQEFWR